MEITVPALAIVVPMAGMCKTKICHNPNLFFISRLCQHRWTAVSNMVAFHNTVGSEQMTNWYSPSNQQIAFGRGNEIATLFSSYSHKPLIQVRLASSLSTTRTRSGATPSPLRFLLELIAMLFLVLRTRVHALAPREFQFH